MAICNLFIHSHSFPEALLCAEPGTRAWGTETTNLQALALGEHGCASGQQGKYCWSHVTGDTGHCTGGSGAQRTGHLLCPKLGEVLKEGMSSELSLEGWGR